MLDPFTLALIGAGTGALLDNDKPLRGAAIGGTLGYGGGTLLGAGGVGGSTSPFSVGAGANGIGTNFMAGGDVGRGLVMNASTASKGYAAGANPAAFLAPTGQEVGAFNAFNMKTGAPINVGARAIPATGYIAGEIGGANLVDSGLPSNVTTMQDFAGSQFYGANNQMLGNPMLGGVNPLSDANYAQIANSVPEGGMFDGIDKIKPYFNVQNLMAADKLSQRFQPKPISAGSGGRVNEGKPPSPSLGGNIQTLLAKVPERRRISLL